MSDFVPASGAIAAEACAYLICVSDEGILKLQGQPWQVLHYKQLPPIDEHISHSHYLGTYRGQACHAAYVAADTLSVIQVGFEWVPLRSQLGLVGDAMFQLAGRAVQTVNWFRDHQYCGRCGGGTTLSTEDRATVCNNCGMVFFPRLAPCVIGVVENGEYCLLARHKRSRSDRFSALAGFIEPGESVEQALAREVREEVGLEIDSVRYFTSQPWPFPGQLMLGFHACLAGGKLQPDDVEIAEAHWFHWSDLPSIPPASTISGQLIRDFVQRNNRD